MKCTYKEQLTCNSEKLGCEGCFYNDEIKIGEYIRTIQGFIQKVTKIKKYSDGDIHIFGKDFVFYRPKEIVKHSSNIIELVEVGDFINKKCIEKIAYYDNYIDVMFINDIDCYSFDDKTLKECSIVTKEQFSSVEYRLED